MRVLAFALLIAVSCGSSRDDAERKARAAQAAVSAEAERRKVQAQAEAHELAQRAATAKDDVEAKAKAALADARARELATKIKTELDKVYQSKSDYDLDVTTQAATSAHAEKLAAMPHVTVGDLTVGYEQASGLSMAGSSSMRHFRATWRRGDRDVIVGYQTQSNLDVVAFAKLLQKLVPIVEQIL